ncbi:hypothetical protein ACJ41O_014749 [Fusarium nematophilum]
MAKTRVLVVGTGGIGAESAYGLEKGGLAEVTAVMRSNYEAVLRNGIDMDSCQYGQIKTWRPVAMTAGRTAIVLSQNGMNIEKPLGRRFPTNPFINSVAYTGATEMSHGRILNDGPDTQRIGAFSSPQVPKEQPRKQRSATPLAYNSSFNPVAAILRMDTPCMRMSRHVIDDLVLPIILEIRALAEPLREGEKLGVPTPTLWVVYGAMKGLQLQIKEAKCLCRVRFEPSNPYL